MRVRLKANIDASKSEQKRIAAWLAKNQDYLVMEISGSKLRIDHDPESEGGGLWETRHFDVTNAEIPSNWVVELDADGRVRLAPRRWLEPGFWEAFYDGDTPDLTWAQHNAQYRGA